MPSIGTRTSHVHLTYQQLCRGWLQPVRSEFQTISLQCANPSLSAPWQPLCLNLPQRRAASVQRQVVLSSHAPRKRRNHAAPLALAAAACAKESGRTVRLPLGRQYEDRDRFMTFRDLRPAAVSSARSTRDPSRERGKLAWCIHIAKQAASRSPSRGRSRRTISYDL